MQTAQAADQIRAIIAQLRRDLPAIPEGAERQYIEERLELMEQILEEYLG